MNRIRQQQLKKKKRQERKLWKKLRGKPRKQKVHSLRSLWLKVGNLVRFRPVGELRPGVDWCFDPGIHTSGNTVLGGVADHGYKGRVCYDKLCMVLELRHAKCGHVEEVKVLFEEKMFWVYTSDLRPCNSVVRER